MCVERCVAIVVTFTVFDGTASVKFASRVRGECMRRSVKGSIAGSAIAALAAALAIGPASGTTVPGITSTQVSLGAIVTQSGFGTADFPAYISGVQAYLAYVNSTGGVYKRQLKLTNVLDDQSSSTQNITDAQQLVLTNHVFAVVGVSSIFFGGHAFLAKSHTPTFGYVTDTSWSTNSKNGQQNNLFGDYGSVLDYASTVPDFAFIARKTNSTKVALISYNVPQSKNICQPALNTFKSKFGLNVAYSDLAVNPITPNFSTDVIKMRNAGVNFIVNCMDYGGGWALNQQLKTYGMNPVQVWMDGYDRGVIQNHNMLGKTYFILQHVPFEAAATYPTAYPGLNLYIKWMAKSGHTTQQYDDVALMGWESANLFTLGLRAAGASPTQAAVVNAINKIKNDTGGGVGTPTNWTTAHSTSTSPSCITYVSVSNAGTSSAKFVQAYNTGKNPWVCYPLTGPVNVLKPIKPPLGSPGT